MGSRQVGSEAAIEAPETRVFGMNLAHAAIPGSNVRNSVRFAKVRLAVAAALGIAAAEARAQNCPAGYKIAAGACVQSCPGGYEDTGRICVYRRQGWSAGG